MNDKRDILDAWITIEQLSEGSIKKTDKKLRAFHANEEFFDKLFSDFLIQQKEQRKMKDYAFKKSGLVLYFNIFDFQEIIDILRKKYRIPSVYEDISKTDKFTFALYFDNQLNFIPDRLFFTISGYIRYKHELPKDFIKAENSLRDDLNKQFEDNDFNTVLKKLLKQYNVGLERCRFGFLENLERDDVNLHSFFIEDLKRAKKISTVNLNRYLNGFSGKRRNLDSKKDSPHFNSALLQEVLQPKFYPLGRFPSNPNYPLSFMQEVAVNLALNDKNEIRSVNGPPGTGKTTLLKDIFAELIVQQADEICNLSNKKIDGSLRYWKNAKLGVLPRKISEKNSVVASSNNGAVQNIVNELPKITDIAEEFKEEILRADYFKTIANGELHGEWKKSEGKNFRELTINETINEKWGSFSLEGGRRENVEQLLLTIEFMDQYFEDEYKSNPTIYGEFLTLQKQVSNERNQAQIYSEQLQELTKLEEKNRLVKEHFSKEMRSKSDELEQALQDKRSKVAELQKEVDTLRYSLGVNKDQAEKAAKIFAEGQETLNEITSKEPRFLWLKKIFRNKEANSYLKKVSDAQNKQEEISKQSQSLDVEEARLTQQVNRIEGKQENSRNEMQQITARFDQWLHDEEANMVRLESQMNALKKIISNSPFKGIDFSVTYEELQKSSPWFTKEFREKQSELFIKALEVRKQFLYENKQHLVSSRKIWSDQDNYFSKERGPELVLEAWQWINLAIPVVSTTFASFGRMFRNIQENALGNLFIDEAGQALPQASVGAIFRSKKVMVVGDPSQIKPVLTLDAAMLNLIARRYQVDETFVSADASTQTIVDATSQLGFQKEEDEWIGIPLWVHRRSKDPMFTISNRISYNGLMVQGKTLEESSGIAQWVDISGKANDKFVKEQAVELRERIYSRIKEDSSIKKEIYVISPFKNVAYQLVKELDTINFTEREGDKDGKGGKPINVGTVHTFQGKEAKIVYFVLGADFNSKGAASWAVSEPNLMNVAATRAKEEFYIIGDKALYSSLGSDIANKTISIIDRYNNEV